MLPHLNISKDLQELTLHGTKEFPVALYETVMRLGSMDFLPLHWHKEIQFVYIKSGRVQYRVGTDVFILEEGRDFLSMYRDYMKPNHIKLSKL